MEGGTRELINGERGRRRKIHSSLSLSLFSCGKRENVRERQQEGRLRLSLSSELPDSTRLSRLGKVAFSQLSIATSTGQIKTELLRRRKVLDMQQAYEQNNFPPIWKSPNHSLVIRISIHQSMRREREREGTLSPSLLFLSPSLLPQSVLRRQEHQSPRTYGRQEIEEGE